MAKVWFQANDASLGSRELKWGVTRVGRSPDNHLVIDHPSISTHHCEFVLGLDTLLIRDCGSTNGTFLDGAPVREASLDPGQTLRFGEIEGRVYFCRDAVRVPELPRRQPRRPVTYDDGTLSCLNHEDRRASRQCPRCAGVFCDDCIHTLSFKGRKRHRFCPICSTETELIEWGEGTGEQLTFWQRLKESFSGRKP